MGDPPCLTMSPEMEMWLYKTLLLEEPLLVNPGQSVTQTPGDWAVGPRVSLCWHCVKGSSVPSTLRVIERNKEKSPELTLSACPL